jgi:alpha-N-arabinofuranosidase
MNSKVQRRASMNPPDMMRLTARILVMGLIVSLASGIACAGDVTLTIDADEVVGRVDERIYGHFLEHIYHSCNGGLWGEMIWNRSFEVGAGSSQWAVIGDRLVQKGRDRDIRLTFGDPTWRDYEYTLEARKTGGDEGFLILFRVADEKRFYWANLGGWHNEWHGLERGDIDHRRGVSRRVQGTIQGGIWYRIRVRCGASRVQVWLDDHQVIDFTDPRPHLTGGVGVGTWATQAEFRNIKVNTLDGKTLFSGLPKPPGPPSVAKFWEPYGPGRFAIQEGDALNCESCQTFAGDGSETGVQQTPLCIRQGETYRGSLWARGESLGGIVVRLLNGTHVLQEVTLPAPTSEWREYPIVLKPEAAAENATVQIGLRGKGSIALDQVSLMPDSWRATGGFRPDLLKAIADLRPPILRWPGGSFTTHYRWKDAIGPQHKRVKYPRAMWDDQDVNSLGTDEFIALCRKVGAEPDLVLNFGRAEPPEQRPQYIQEACDWLEYCNGPATSTWGKVRAANGHPEPYHVKFWEMDNETWNMKPDDYAQAVREFVAAMKKIDPSITIIACGSGQLGGHWKDGDTAVINQCAEIVDYLSVHHYESPTKYADGPATAEKFWRSLGQQIAVSKNPKMRLFVSEWNAQSTDWRTGLYAGGALNMFERCECVGMAAPALFLRHVSAKAWDNAFINFDHRGWFPAPNYVVMKLWRDHYQPQRLALGGDTGNLSVSATKSEDGRKLVLKVVNPTDQPLTVAVQVKGAFLAGQGAWTLVAAESPEARNSLDKPDAIRPVAAPTEVSGQTIRVVMPRWSTGVLAIAAR